MVSIRKEVRDAATGISRVIVVFRFAIVAQKVTILLEILGSRCLLGSYPRLMKYDAS